MNLKNLASRLKNRIDNTNEVSTNEGLVDLMDAHMNMVSAAAVSIHGSGHLSGHASAATGETPGNE